MGKLIESILELEWEMFQNTQNIGGRASCQDDKKTFFRMRESQWTVLSDEVLEGCYRELKTAADQGRNMIAEKYGYMMKSYDPEGYAAIADMLPQKSHSERELTERIVSAYMEWNEELIKQIPCILGNGRPLRSCEDQIGDVSLETYMRGELLTFSEAVLQKYWNYVQRCRIQNVNLSRRTYEALARSYGYQSLEKAEAYLKQQKNRRT